MLHAAWRDGLVVFGWRGRVLDRKTVTSLAATVFVDHDVRWAAEELLLAVPGRARPLEVVAVAVSVPVAGQAFLVRQWVPWRSLSPSLAWFSMVALAADAMAVAGAVVPSLTTTAKGAQAGWAPVIDDRAAQLLVALTTAQPEVVGSIERDAAPWQITQAAFGAFVDDAVRSRLFDVPASLAASTGRGAATVVANRFLAGLTSEDGEVLARTAPERAAAARLATALRRWTEPLSGRSPLADVKVRARVVPPDELDLDALSVDPTWKDLPLEDVPWMVELELSPADDPSLFVAAADVWDADGATALGVEHERAGAALVLATRRIKTLSPTLHGALDPEQPATALLSLTDAITFLTDEAAGLDDAGIAVLLPAWWGSRAKARVSGRATPAEAAVTPAGLDSRSLAQVDWRLALGDVRLDDAELERLAAAKAPLVHLRGRWVAFDPHQVRHALTTLGDHRRDRAVLGPLDVVRLGAEAERSGDDLEVEGTDWVAELLAGLPDDRIEPVMEPSSFAGTLRPYQRRGLGWMAFLARLGLGGCLADDMGLGKTAQLLALLVHERAGGTTPSTTIGPTLVVCPLSVVRTWELEAARFTPSLRVVVHHGAERSKDDALVEEVMGADLVITTYAIATRDVATLSRIGWRRLVADEAQHVKNPGTAAARALRRIKAPQRLALTGTPVENRLSELWAVCDLVNPGLLGSATSFRERFAVPIERHRDPEATARLRSLVQPFLLRRSKSDRALVPELPPKVEQVAWATLTREQASLYRSVVDVLLTRLRTLEGMDRRGAILAAIVRLKQICNHPAQYLGDGSRLEGRSGKLTRFDELVDDVLDSDGSMLVFTQYRVMGELLQQHLHHRIGLDAPFLHGGVAKARRDRMVERFQDGSAGPILLVSLKAGGSGLNLTAANEVVHYDRWWNPAVEDQASDRAWRIGQQRSVLVHKLVCQGTVEERIDELINAKKDLASRVIGEGEGWLTELTTDELRDLLVLREPRR